MRYAFFTSSLTFNKDGLATNNNCDFMQEALFQESYTLGKHTNSWSGSDLRWRLTSL